VKLAKYKRRKAAHSLHMWNIDLIQIQYYEKQVTLRGGHIIDWEGKRRKLKR
jgi:hypothetical protein